MKPAGGIRQAKQAVQYLVLLHETLGLDWLTPDLFRFGSTLLNDVLMQIRKQKTGAYQSLDYSDRLMSEVERGRPRSGAARVGLRPRARSARHRALPGSLRPLHRRRGGRAALRQWFTSSRREGSRSPRSLRPARKTSRSPSRRLARRSRSGWSDLRPAERAKYLFRIAASSRSGRASWRSRSRSTAASRSASRGTSTCRSPRRTSSTTPAGPTSSSTRSRTGGRSSASPRRSSRGTSRC